MASSLFRKPQMAKIGLKVLAYGDSGVGKTTFALSFPQIAAVDSESGMSHYEGNPNIVLIANTSSCYDVEEAIVEIEDNADVIQTLVIDSETKVYDSMQTSAMEVEEKRARKKGGEIEDSTISIRGYGRIKLLNKRLQNMKIALSSKGINIVSIAQMDDIKEKRGENFVKVGEKPVMAKGIQYDYDIVLKLFTEATQKGDVYKAVIEKDRTSVYKKGDIIDNPNFSHWKDYFEGRSKLQNLKVDYSTDTDRDIRRMSEEAEDIDLLISDFKAKMKILSAEDKPKIMKKLKEVGIENPLATIDYDGMKKVIDFIDGLLDTE
jgi:hypothetical protein